VWVELVLIVLVIAGIIGYLMRRDRHLGHSERDLSPGDARNKAWSDPWMRF
jgi:hypothetical protein